MKRKADERESQRRLHEMLEKERLENVRKEQERLEIEKREFERREQQRLVIKFLTFCFIPLWYAEYAKNERCVMSKKNRKDLDLINNSSVAKYDMTS